MLDLSHLRVSLTRPRLCARDSAGGLRQRGALSTGSPWRTIEIDTFLPRGRPKPRSTGHAGSYPRCMFLVGLELDPALLRKRGHATVAISHASILTPFLLGAVLSLLLYPRLSSSNVPFTAFSLFVGVSMSVTAFPVLLNQRIVRRRGERVGLSGLRVYETGSARC
jgi:hypothetical protein